MTTPARCYSRIALAAAFVVGAAAAPAFAQMIGPSNFDAAVPCGAFQSAPGGGWTAVAPVTLHIDNGTSISIAPGHHLAPGSTIDGVAVPVIITRHCGNM